MEWFCLSSFLICCFSLQEAEGDEEAQTDSLVAVSEQRRSVSVTPNNYTTSKVAYFKRKYAEEEDLHPDLQGNFQRHLIPQEDRSCILKLSLEKLRFLEDPEAYLRRSVLINNLLRKIYHEEEELEAEEEEEEEDVGEEEEVEMTWEREQQKLMYPERKKVKVLVTDCCSQAFGLDELHRYPLVPCYPPAGCLYSLHTCAGLNPNHKLLLCNLDGNG